MWGRAVSSTIVAVTGSNGFIGRNLTVRLTELGFEVAPITRDCNEQQWIDVLSTANVVIHLAGANRPVNDAEFREVNVGVTQRLTELLVELGRVIPVIYASSAKADDASEYGCSKRLAEEQLQTLAETLGNKLYIYRLPNVFGKWARPNYNSAVATFCHNTAHNIPIDIHDPAAPLTLVYIDDVVAEFISTIEALPPSGYRNVHPAYTLTVGDVADIIRGFQHDRSENLIANVGVGLTRALYATYVSTLPTDQFSYRISSYTDPRGSFSEMLKTREAGQFSYFTAHPGVTRGGHYHHTKTEKFLIVHGHARFRFRNILTDEKHEVVTSGDYPVVVETIPGWSHDVTNVGDDILVSLLWANELFDREKPDTVSMKVF
jgi:UDP-2-acetamido-2,6-beta-L-arabino-hexul-4-ose reductase